MLNEEQVKEIIGNDPIISDEDTAELSIRLIKIISETENQNALTHDLTLIKQEAARKRQSVAFSRALDAARVEMYDDPDFIVRNIKIETGYTRDDFLNGIEPFKKIYEIADKFEQRQEYSRLKSWAKVVGVGNGEFNELYKAFEQSMRYSDGDYNRTNELPELKDKPIDLYLGGWICDPISGVKRFTDKGEEVACLHPVVPIKRLVNIDTDEEKLEVAFLKGRNWKTFMAPKNELFDAAKLVKYSARGLSVTSRSAKVLSEYLCEIEGLNYNKITEVESVARLGYIGNGQFSPYLDGVVFDGDSSYRVLYDAVKKKGSYETWREMAIKCRDEGITAQIMLAASFASVLINKIGALVFFVHLWSIASGTGKTVALMLAASVWGNPELGQLVQTFNATQVGHERTAAFLNNIPMCIDELQLSKDSHGRSRFDVYQLGQGVGRNRGNKYGGVDKTPTWSLCVLTTGETPIVGESDGAGAVNRVIDIECGANDVVIKNGLETSRCVKQNYGHAGEMFVEQLTDDVIEEAKALFDGYFKELSSGETTEKQAMAAAVILVGDELADRFIFKTGKHLTVSDISNMLKTKTSVSAGERGYSYICDWVAMNANKFKKDNDITDIYGVVEDGYAYIIYKAFDEACKKEGFNTRAILSWLKANGLITTGNGKDKFTKTKRLRSDMSPPKCVCLRLPEGDELPDIEGFEDLI